MYVIAPKNTAPIEIAFSKISGMPATMVEPAVRAGSRPNATLWNARAVGALSRNELRAPVA